MASQKTSKVRAAPEYQVLQQADLTGGLDLRRAQTRMAAERSRTCLNFSLSEPGTLRVRPGYAAWSSNSLGSSGGQGGVRAYLASTQFSLYAWGGGVYKPTDTGGLSTTPVLSGLASTASQVHFCYDRHIVGVFDSTSTPQKSTNGTDWTRLGIAAGSVASTLSTGGSTGKLSTSEFEVTYTYKDRGLAFESDGAPVSTTTIESTASGAITVNIPNSTDAQVDAIVVYARNKTAGESVLRRVSSLAQSTGASSTYVITSSAWSAETEIPTTHGTAPVLKFAVNWKNRWWGADATVENRIWFTDLFQNQAWYALYYIDLPFERGDAVAALVPLGDTLVVFGGTRSYLIIGATSLDFEVRPSAGSQAGALGPRAVAAIENGIVHAASEGVFLFDGATDKLLTYDLEPAWRDLIERSSATDLATVALLHDYLQKELRIAVPRLYPWGTRGEWVLDLNRTREGGEPAWAQTSRSIGGYIHWNGDEPTAGDRGKIVSWSPSVGSLYQESVGDTWDSSNVTAEFEGPAFSLGLSRARFVDLHAEVEPHGGAFTVEAVTDGVSQGQLSLNIGEAGAVLGTAIAGVSTLPGAGRRKCHTHLPLSADGRSVTVKASYTGAERFAWFGYAIGLVPEVVPRQWTE
jgi:hypothetical protein